MKGKLCCDKCGTYLGEYLFGKGGVIEKAWIGTLRSTGLPDILCLKCFREENPKIKGLMLNL